MSDLKEASLSAGDKTVTLPVHQPTLGQPCIDIAKPVSYTHLTLPTNREV